MTKSLLNDIKKATNKGLAEASVEKGKQILERVQRIENELTRQLRNVTKFRTEFEHAIAVGDISDNISMDIFIDEHVHGAMIVRDVHQFIRHNPRR